MCFNCGLVKNSDGTVNSENNTICHCNPTFAFDLSSNTCICPIAESIINNNVCFECSTISLYSTGKASSTIKDTCECNLTFAFNKNDNTCGCPIVNSIIDTSTKCFACGSLRNKNGTGNIGSTNTTCECNPTFVFT